MKTLKLIALASLAFSFSHCKTMSPTAPAGSGPSLVEGIQILDSAQAKFYSITNANLSNTRGQDMLLLASWLQSQATVKSVLAFDSTDLDIELKSGLHTLYSCYTLGTDSLSLTRGGTRAATELMRRSNILSTNAITNKNILIYSPFVWGQNTTSFPLYHKEDMDALTSLLSSAGSEFKVTISYGSSLDEIRSFGNYGLVILDTHGAPQGFYTSIQLPDYSSMVDATGKVSPLTDAEFKEFVEKAIAPGATDLLENGSLLLSGWSAEGAVFGWQKNLKSTMNGYRIVIGGKFINDLPPMANTIIFGNFCYSGWESTSIVNHLDQSVETIPFPIMPAFTSKQLISYYYYGYLGGGSSSVSDIFSRAMEDTIITHLLIKRDSTGDAFKDMTGGNFTDANYNKVILFHAGADDYSYMKCGDTLLDPRDGQKYPTVCIGNQVWMAQNLNYAAPTSICYDDIASNCTIYGKLYDWNTLMAGAGSTTANPSKVRGVCPNGWHVPSSTEYEDLISALGGASIAGGAMKSTSGWSSPNTGATNSSGISAIPAGYSFAPASTGTSIGAGTTAAFGSASIRSNGSHAVYEMLNAEQSVGFVDAQLSNANSCRCVKDP